MLTIIPAILTNDVEELQEKLLRVEGKVERVQIDIIDGVFAENKTVFPDVLETIDTNLRVDFQLMTKEPADWVERCARGMADRIIGHVEQMSSQIDFVGKVQEVGARVGLALDLETPVSAIDPVILQNLDLVLVMSVKAGFGGQEFHSGTLNKVKQLDEIRARDKTPFIICLDGGINEHNISQAVRAGVDEVAIGAHLFTEPIETHIKNLQEAAYAK